MADLWMFAATLTVGYLLPGPDMLLLLQTSARHGRAQALATAAGLAVARSLHVLVAALGLAALLRTAPWLFDTARFGGAAYLIWLGVAIVRAPSALGQTAGTGAARRSGAVTAAARLGLLTNLLNPKALLFCSVLLPQFLRTADGAIAGQFLMMGIAVVATGVIFDLVYIGAGVQLGRWIANHPFAGTFQQRLFAFLLIGFGLRMALVSGA